MIDMNDSRRNRCAVFRRSQVSVRVEEPEIRLPFVCCAGRHDVRMRSADKEIFPARIALALHGAHFIQNNLFI
jgi:hypothetical protein